MKGGAGLSPKCQCSCRFSYSRSLWESQSWHLLSQPRIQYLAVLWRIYIPRVVSLFYNNRFWMNRKKERCLTQRMTGATPQPHRPSWLPPSVVRQGTGADILWSLIPRATCPTIVKLQSREEDNSKEGMGLGQVYQTDTGYGGSGQSESCATFKEPSGRCICFWPPRSSKFSRNRDLLPQAEAASSASRQVSIGILNS